MARPTETAIRPVWYGGPDSGLGEFWTMLHLPYTAMVLSFVLLAAAVSPRVSWGILIDTLVAYFLGLGIGAHFLDQIPGMGSHYVRHWPPWALWAGGISSVAAAVVIGLVGVVWFGGPALLVLVIVQGVCAIGYPLAPVFGGWLHRTSVFAVAWGALPFLTSYFAQAHAFTVLSFAIAAILGVVAWTEIHLSRESRRLRSREHGMAGSESAGRTPGGNSFVRFDRFLQILSAGSVTIGVGGFVLRLLLG